MRRPPPEGPWQDQLVSFVGCLGCFVVQYLIFATAVFLDRRAIFPKWLAYMTVWNIVTEFLAAPVWIFKSGVFALGVHAARASDRSAASRFLAMGAACGLAFVALKAWEWYLNARGGLGFDLNPFFTYYYALTGVHFLHVLFGLGFLALMWRELQVATAPRVSFLEGGAIYWHMVDLLWIPLFALLYLMR